MGELFGFEKSRELYLEEFMKKIYMGEFLLEDCSLENKIFIHEEYARNPVRFSASWCVVKLSCDRERKKMKAWVEFEKALAAEEGVLFVKKEVCLAG